jgi:hypothetical protein
MRPEPQWFYWEETRRAFTDAAQWFVQMVPLVGDRWSRPALGEWDVRALVGHTSRAFLTVEMSLDRPASTVDVGSVADYFHATRSISAGPDVAARGRPAGSALALTQPRSWTRPPNGCFGSSTPATVPRR